MSVMRLDLQAMKSANWQRINMKKQTGFSLVELMIAMLLGIIVVGGTIAMYVTTVRGGTNTINSARLNYDLDSVMQIMVNDIRRAGYWGGATVNSLAVNNPFTVSGTNAGIQISNKTGEEDNSCILYTYDEDGDGTLETGEYFGFRHNGDGIDMRVGGAFSDCDGASWNNIIDSDKVVIEELSFTANYKCLNVTQNDPEDGDCAGHIATGEKGVETRQIDILLEGEVKGDDEVTKSLTGIVKVRNERIFIQP
ncbi:MAG: hypothetical protein GQ583_07680 [Methyloprofundus sp.]|nr:hypothetical protein [Methyloprofundus sp.]